MSECEKAFQEWWDSNDISGFGADVYLPAWAGWQAAWNSRPPSLGERAGQQLATAKAALEQIADGFDVSPPMLPTRMVCIAAEALRQLNSKGGAK